MTIVFTKDGSLLINDGAVQYIHFDREKQQVDFMPLGESVGIGLPTKSISRVQQVIYHAEISDKEFDDSCQEIIDLRDEVQEQTVKYKELLRQFEMIREYAFKLEEKDPDLFQEIEKEVQEKYKHYLEERRKRLNPQNDEQDQSKPSD